MTMNEYQEAQMRTAPTNYVNDFTMLVNASLGLCGESGEVADIIKKNTFQGHDLDKKHVAEELGDILWYVSLGAKSLGYTLDEIAEMNVNKLKKRYPDGFDPQRSVCRED